jgi:hypothetical protein
VMLGATIGPPPSTVNITHGILDGATAARPA